MSSVGSKFLIILEVKGICFAALSRAADKKAQQCFTPASKAELAIYGAE